MKKGDVISRFLSLFIVVILAFSVFGTFVLAEEDPLLDSGFDDVVEDPLLDTTEEVVVAETAEVAVDDGSFNLVKTEEWLLNKSRSASSISALSMSIVVLNNNRYPVSEHVEKLISQANQNLYCWPSGACELKATSYALLAMYAAGQTEVLAKGMEWMKSTLKDAQAENPGWQLVIDADQNGTCGIGLVGEEIKDYELKDNMIYYAGANKGYSLSETEIGSFNGKVLPEIAVTCLEFPAGTNIVTSLNYQKGLSNIYIVDSSSTVDGKILVPNGCFPFTKDSGCDYGSSLIATWALMEMGEDLDAYGTYVYLESKLADNKVDDLAMLTRMLLSGAAGGSNVVSNYYVNTLVEAQHNKGWQSSVKTTAMATYALTAASRDEATLGKEYIKDKWNEEGNWESNVETTAWALLALSGANINPGYVVLDEEYLQMVAGGSIETICYNNVDDDQDGLVDCYDSDCADTNQCLYCNNNILDEGEEDVDCGGICSISCSGSGTYDPYAVESGFIDCSDGLDNDGNGLIDCADPACAADCSSDGGISGCTSDDDCSIGQMCENALCVKEDEGSSGLWIWILIIILILAGGGAFAYFKFFKGKGFNFGKKKPPVKSGMAFANYKASRPLPSRPIVSPVGGAAPVRSTPISRVPVAAYEKDDELERSLKKAEELLGKK